MSRFLRIALSSGLVLALGIASILGAYSLVNAATGGPDAFGYYFTDSTEAGGPSYSWIDISGTGTPLGLSDDSHAYPVPIGFTFNYYGVGYNNVAVESNGGIAFVDWFLTFGNSSLPYGAQPFIATLWDDLNPGAGGEIYYETLGSAPNRTFVVQWDGVPHWSVGDAATFEVILYEGSNEIIIQYADTDLGNPGYDWGQSATVGIQQDGTNALQYSFNLPVITNPLAILFYPTTLTTRTVGGEVYPIDKTNLLLPWIGPGLVLILAAGGLILGRRAGRLK